MTTPSKTAGSKALGYGCLTIIGAFAALIVVASVIPKDAAQEAIRKADNQQLEAFVMCQQFMEPRLRAPASADFAMRSASTIERMADDDYERRPFRITSYVDAQNAFGAQVRTHFTCTVKPRDGKNWQLVDLKTDAQ